MCMGSIYYKLGNPVEELQMYQQAKGAYKEAFGKQHVLRQGLVRTNTKALPFTKGSDMSRGVVPLAVLRWGFLTY